MNPDVAARLREPFPPEQIGHLPKGGQMLAFCGHAAVTDRLLKVDPEWTWEPVAFAEDGSPLIVFGANNAALWIRLTVCGVTRLGVGTAATGAFELPKQLISDAIRNAAMRFGVALDLWAKEDLSPEPASHDEAPIAPGSPMDRVNALVGPQAAKLAKACREKGLPWPLTDLDDGQLATFDALYKAHAHKQEVTP